MGMVVEVLDTDTGLRCDGSESAVSSHSLSRATAALPLPLPLPLQEGRGDEGEGADTDTDTPAVRVCVGGGKGSIEGRGKPAPYMRAKALLKGRLEHPRLGSWRGFYSMLPDRGLKPG
jgi:hypothetical protein